MTQKRSLKQQFISRVLLIYLHTHLTHFSDPLIRVTVNRVLQPSSTQIPEETNEMKTKPWHGFQSARTCPSLLNRDRTKHAGCRQVGCVARDGVGDPSCAQDVDSSSL